MTGRLPDGSYDFTGQQRQGGSTVYEAARPERSRRVLNNPLRYTDPTGTMWMDAERGGAGALTELESHLQRLATDPDFNPITPVECISMPYPCVDSGAGVDLLMLAEAVPLFEIGDAVSACTSPPRASAATATGGSAPALHRSYPEEWADCLVGRHGWRKRAEIRPEAFAGPQSLLAMLLWFQEPSHGQRNCRTCCLQDRGAG